MWIKRSFFECSKDNLLPYGRMKIYDQLEKSLSICADEAGNCINFIAVTYILHSLRILYTFFT